MVDSSLPVSFGRILEEARLKLAIAKQSKLIALWQSSLQQKLKLHSTFLKIARRIIRAGRK